jgi:hypothetical protein
VHLSNRKVKSKTTFQIVVVRRPEISHNMLPVQLPWFRKLDFSDVYR